jgi:hypothetical protein
MRPGFQAEIVPLRLAKMKKAFVPSPSMKDEAFVLETCPVGPSGPLAVVVSTVRGTLLTVVLPVTVYRIAVLVPWFETQKGVLKDGEEMNETPQEFTKLGSATSASPEMSETRFV